jgi:hypothetical protein
MQIVETSICPTQAFHVQAGFSCASTVAARLEYAIEDAAASLQVGAAMTTFDAVHGEFVLKQRSAFG